MPSLSVQWMKFFATSETGSSRKWMPNTLFLILNTRGSFQMQFSSQSTGRLAQLDKTRSCMITSRGHPLEIPWQLSVMQWFLSQVTQRWTSWVNTWRTCYRVSGCLYVCALYTRGHGVLTSRGSHWSTWQAECGAVGTALQQVSFIYYNIIIYYSIILIL